MFPRKPETGVSPLQRYARGKAGGIQALSFLFFFFSPEADLTSQVCALLSATFAREEELGKQCAASRNGGGGEGVTSQVCAGWEPIVFLVPRAVGLFLPKVHFDRLLLIALALLVAHPSLFAPLAPVFSR